MSFAPAARNLIRSAVRSGKASHSSLIRRNFQSASPQLARILCCDNIDPVCVDIFEENGHEVDYKSKVTDEELCEIIPKYEGLVVRSGTKVTENVLSKATNLKVVGRAGVGVDNINIPAATKHGVLVMNTPGGNTVSTAQLAFSLMCSMARNIAQADISMKNGEWKRKEYMGTEMSGKTLAIIGCGRIGQTFAKWAHAMNMNVIGFDPAMSINDAADKGIKLMSLMEIWPQADFITLHTPLTPDTRNLIDKDSIAQMKDNVRIINCARGGIINEADLVEALDAGKVAGAAMDVYETEPPAGAGLALVAHPKVTCTPHLGASTDEAQINVARDVAQQMCATLAGQEYVGVLNVDYMDMANNPRAGPFVALGEMLGKLAVQKFGGAGRAVVGLEVQAWGEHGVALGAASARKLLRAVILKGMLSKMEGVPAAPSLINAPLLAEQMGLRSSISEARPMEGSPYTNLVSAVLTLENGETHVLTGSVFGQEPHLVQLDGYRSFPAFRPSGGTLLTFVNDDRPGAISEVLELLGAESVNVAGMALGRQDRAQALCLMDLDSAPSPACARALQELSQLQDVRIATLS